MSTRQPWRPTKLTHELISQADTLLRAGNWVDTVAQMLGVTRRTFYNWLKRGEEEALRLEDGGDMDEDENIFADFFHTVERARAFAEVNSVRVLRTGASQRIEGDWKASLAWLERARPDRWGKRQIEQKLTIAKEEPSRLPVEDLSDDALDEVIAALERKQAQEQGDDGEG